MQAWLEAGQFNQTSLINGNLTHVGMACSCSSTSEVICGFLFTHTYIGYAVSEPNPLYLPYTSGASCGGVPETATFGTSSCNSS